MKDDDRDPLAALDWRERELVLQCAVRYALTRSSYITGPRITYDR